MTAIVTIVRSNAVEILTDSAVVDPKTGVLRQTMSKVAQLPTLNAVIAVRGSAHLLSTFAASFENAFTSFDHMRERLPGFLEGDILPALRVLFPGGEPLDLEFDLVVAGWTNAGEPCAYLICNHDGHGLPQMTPVDMPGLGLLPGGALVDRALDCLDLANLDAVVDGFAIMDAQRQHIATEPREMTRGFAAGGYCQLTRIFPSAIETRIVGRWPDRIGEPVAASWPDRSAA